ncbi:MAG: hypothetical protein D6B27_02355 [Gammaproteobacteria bacterium]|nr:MAG: hypothetical protein D6B27_02355 [Gammaproteobacteria bacterium]
MEYDKDIGMWHKKDYSGYLIKECYKTKYVFDERGLVDNYYEYSNNKNDIIMLGDSQVEALMVNNKDIIHNQLYFDLGEKYNVLNYGLSGTGPSQHLQVLEKKVNLNNSKAVIHFIFLENDLNDGDQRVLDGTNRPKVFSVFDEDGNYSVVKPKKYDTYEMVRDLLGKFEMYVYLKKTFYYYRHAKFLQGEPKQKKEKNANEVKLKIENEEYKWRQLKGAITHISKLLKKKNTEYFLVIYSKHEFENGITDRARRLEQFLNETGISYVNIVPFLKNEAKQYEISFVCDRHWNGKTHNVLSKFLSNSIAEHVVLKIR